MTGWVLTVAFNASAGPSATSVQRSCASTSEASSNVRRTIADSEYARIMPTVCEPCPGNTNANFFICRPCLLPANEHRAPGETATHAFEQHVLAFAYASVARRF